MALPKISYDHLIQQHLSILRSLQTDSGLFLASPSIAGTGYDKAWLRDNFYECLAFEMLGDWKTVHKTYRAILKILKKHESKIDWAIQNKPMQSWQYIHARYHPKTFDEFWENWGNKQNDAVGCILFKLGELEERGLNILKNEDDRRIVQKLIHYLSSIEYWHDPDSGIWEEGEEIHASSIGAVVAGLRKIAQVPDIHVEKKLIDLGKEALHKLLPRESASKFADLALLTLIYPYDVVTKAEARQILKNIEYHLVRQKGVIRYKGDHYYNKNSDRVSEEAEWCFGFSFLAIIYQRLGDAQKAEYYTQKALQTIDERGEVPELYFSNTSIHNRNSPLGWAESLLIVALYAMNLKHGSHQMHLDYIQHSQLAGLKK